MQHLIKVAIALGAIIRTNAVHVLKTQDFCRVNLLSVGQQPSAALSVNCFTAAPQQPVILLICSLTRKKLFAKKTYMRANEKIKKI